MITYGSVCSGYEGIGLGLASLFDLDVRWQAEIDPHASKILEARFPGVPNLGDIKLTDWTAVEPVDIFSAGYPCQPFSHAGKRKGTDDERHLWPQILRAVGALRPRLLVLENVAGHLTLGFAAVLADLATVGYDATWGVVRAADAGAPHGRARIFVVATDSDDERHERTGPAWRRSTGSADDGGDAAYPEGARLERCREGCRGETALPEPIGDHDAPADTEIAEWRGQKQQDLGAPTRSTSEPRERDSARAGHSRTTPDAECLGRDGRSREPEWRSEPRTATAGDGSSLVDWQAYTPAIERWEHTIGWSAPRPTTTGKRGGEALSPRFVEWMMGLPAGWVTDIPISRNEQLKALGNGVVPQQCALAVRTLLDLAEVNQLTPVLGVTVEHN